jgi:hypothetical protein
VGFGVAVAHDRAGDRDIAGRVRGRGSPLKPAWSLRAGRQEQRRRSEDENGAPARAVLAGPQAAERCAAPDDRPSEPGGRAAQE